jgi:hypothetical protein
MAIFPVRTEEDRVRAEARIQELWEAPLGTSEADEREILDILVQAYAMKNSIPSREDTPCDRIPLGWVQMMRERYIFPPTIPGRVVLSLFSDLLMREPALGSQVRFCDVWSAFDWEDQQKMISSWIDRVEAELPLLLT